MPPISLPPSQVAALLARSLWLCLLLVPCVAFGLVTRKRWENPRPFLWRAVIGTLAGAFVGTLLGLGGAYCICHSGRPVVPGMSRVSLWGGGAWMLSQLARSCSVAESTRAAVAAAISCAAGLHIGAAVFRWRSHAGARPALQMRELTYNIPLIDDAHPQDLFAWPWMLLVGVLIVLLAPRLLRLTGRLWSRLLNPPPPPERPVVIPPSPLSPEA